MQLTLIGKVGIVLFCVTQREIYNEPHAKEFYTLAGLTNESFHTKTVYVVPLHYTNLTFLLF